MVAEEGVHGSDPAITAAEEVQLRRVYDLLCDFGTKQAMLKELRPVKERAAVLRAKMDDDSAGDPALASELLQLDRKMDLLHAKVRELQAQSAGVVTADDLHEALKTLGKKTSLKTVEDMIWEVDEDLDGCVDWAEMRLMFARNVRDRSGLEPSQLFNVVQFMIFDKDENNTVSVDETMIMLYARYGRVRMEAKIKELFGNDMREQGKQGGEIDFNAYLKAVEKTQLITFLQSGAGRAQVAKAGNAKKLLGAGVVEVLDNTDLSKTV